MDKNKNLNGDKNYNGRIIEGKYVHQVRAKAYIYLNEIQMKKAYGKVNKDENSDLR